LNDTELDLIADLVPPGEMLIRKAQSSKKVRLNVDSVSYWMATKQRAQQPEKTRLLRPLRGAEGIRQLAIDYPFQTATERETAPSLQPPPTVKEIPDAIPCCTALALCNTLPLTLAAQAYRSRSPRSWPRRLRLGPFYHSQDIVPIRAKVKYTTLIVVPPTEKIMEARWVTGLLIVDVVGNFCFLHPRARASIRPDLITDKGKHLQLHAAGIPGTAAAPHLKVMVEPLTIPRSWLHKGLQSTYPPSSSTDTTAARCASSHVTQAVDETRSIQMQLKFDYA